jgi:hypothetical protein
MKASVLSLLGDAETVGLRALRKQSLSVARFL